jgi:hypothetical protein
MAKMMATILTDTFPLLDPDGLAAHKTHRALTTLPFF